MQIGKVTLATAILAATLTFGASMPAHAASGIMKIAHALPPAAPRNQGALKVAKLLHADSRCDLKVQVYPSGQLGGTAVLIENLQIGALEMALLPASFLVGFQPLIGIMDFPFFFPRNKEELFKIHRSAAMKKLLATTEEKGIKSLTIWHTGYKAWTANTPLNKLANYKGLKARVMPSKVLIKQDELLGLTPIGMPFAETYSALQNNAIDAQENPIATSFFMKFYEVQKYMALTDHGTLDQVIMLGKKWYDGQTSDCRQAIGEALQEGGKLTSDLTYKVIDKAMAAFKKAGMKVVTTSDADYAEMRAKVLPGVEKFYVEQNGARGKEILEAFKKELGM